MSSRSSPNAGTSSAIGMFPPSTWSATTELNDFLPNYSCILHEIETKMCCPVCQRAFLVRLHVESSH